MDPHAARFISEIVANRLRSSPGVSSYRSCNQHRVSSCYSTYEAWSLRPPWTGLLM